LYLSLQTAQDGPIALNYAADGPQAWRSSWDVLGIYLAWLLTLLGQNQEALVIQTRSDASGDEREYVRNGLLQRP
jgi:hypothetical protein